MAQSNAWGQGQVILLKHVPKDDYYRHHKTPIKAGLYELIDYLKTAGYPLGFSTSPSRLEVDHHLQSAGLSNCFQAVADTSMVENSKPAPDLYIKACELLDVSPANCFALEDSKSGIIISILSGVQRYNDSGSMAAG